MTNLFDTAVAAGSFQTLTEAVKAAGLTDTLINPGPITLFAPTDEAFAKLPEKTLNSLLINLPKLYKVLTYHLVPGDVRSEDLEQIDEAPTLEGSVLAIANEQGIQVNDAKIIQTDILAENGVIHIIDGVLMPAMVAGFSRSL